MTFVGADPRRWRLLPVILIGSFLSFLDFFIVNIALPAMRTDLGAIPAELQFVVAAYGVEFGVTLITGGRLGDIFGRKRVFTLGIGGFTLASLSCGTVPNAIPHRILGRRDRRCVFCTTGDHAYGGRLSGRRFWGRPSGATSSCRQ